MLSWKVLLTRATMAHLLKYLQTRNPQKIIIATLFYKPKATVCEIPLTYKGIELENDFVVGRGLDYDGAGKELPGFFTF